MKYLMFLVVIFSFACRKDDSNNEPRMEQPTCFIRNWYDTTFFDSVRKSTFTYNEYGDPISIESQYCCSGTEPDYFAYDLQKRLIKYEHYSLTTYTFQYNNQDSLPMSALEVWFYGQNYELTYTYDNNKRIIRVVRKYLYTENFDDPIFYDSSLTENSVFEYVYDSNGNLVNDLISSADYTDKPSLYRINKWWMFLHRNYSINALNVGSNYNECGYPLVINKNIFLALGAGTIDYDK
jgi:hypothetical protein